uniref:(northern house mosquito) hypothetical protein n=1 Tax=Culex pipiens TaxID=7175 RepID=A0A8D8FPK1_CULPI
MFRYHTSQFGSCAMEIHKTLCYFFAGINIFLALDLLTEYLDDIFAIFEDRTLANLDQDEAVEHSGEVAGTSGLDCLVYGLTFSCSCSGSFWVCGGTCVGQYSFGDSVDRWRLSASSNVRANLPKLHLLPNGGGLHSIGLLVQSHSGARK